jgi:oligopeptide/dipeptide ABC transporter ATP-binding protein
VSEALLRVEDLSVGYRTDHGTLQALRHARLAVDAGEVVGLMGESGSGKSTMAAAIINLLGANAEVTSGRILYRGRDLLTLPAEEQRAIRGQKIAMVFQDPMTSFNPVLTIGEQLLDYQHQRTVPRAVKLSRARDMLREVGIGDPARCLGRYPHELSGGMRQRVAIAAALLMEPDILIADEPTTALDVTMEAQIIHLFRELRRLHHGGIIIVTHHLGVIAELCDRVSVMYAGEVVEEAPVDDIFHAPRHPYTQALLACEPENIVETAGVLPVIPGRVPNLVRPPVGCGFRERCHCALPVCRETPPPVVEAKGHAARCHRVTA